jgi:hypothetical protein
LRKKFDEKIEKKIRKIFSGFYEDGFAEEPEGAGG